MQYISGSRLTFINLNTYNTTIKAQEQYELANYTKVVLGQTFLNDLSGANTVGTVFRIENTFYLPIYGGGVQYSPSYSPRSILLRVLLLLHWDSLETQNKRQ